jgi:3-oxoacyl-[acyl-carrier protein] reductase
MKDALLGRKALITGGNQGLGLEIARHYVQAGANVMICARDPVQLVAAHRELAAVAGSGQIVAARASDVADPDHVDALVAMTVEVLGGLDVLVNNAGIYGPKGDTDTVDWTEWVRTIEVNVHGSVLACRAVLPGFKARGYGKIIQLSGGGATSPMPKISAYAVSKAAIVRFAETLAEEVRGSGIEVNAIAPGALNTRMLDEVIAAGPDLVGADFHARALRQKSNGGTPLNRAAELAVFLASARSDGITGKLISAVWDDWEAWPLHLAELAGSDVYTLRRIAGRDRGFDWGDK